MTDEYGIDLDGLSLEFLRATIEEGYLLPSEKVLTESVQDRFAKLESMGISSLGHLADSLSTKKKIERFSEDSGIPLEYLVVLRRRVGLYTPEPKPLNRMIGIDSKHIDSLAALGIKDTRQMFERVKHRQGRTELAKQSSIPEDILLELTKMTDLSRAPYVGPVYARLLYEAGADTLEKLSASDPARLLDKLREINNKLRLTKGGLPTSVPEMESFLGIVRMIPKAIEY